MGSAGLKAWDGARSKRREEKPEKGAALEQMWTQLAPQGSDVKDTLSSGNMLNPRGETEAENHCVTKKKQHQKHIGKRPLPFHAWSRYSTSYCSASP